MVPNDLLQTWFEQRVPGDIDFKWSQLGEREIDPMVDHLTDLPRAIGIKLENDLRGVYELACDVGMQSIVEAAKHRGETDLLDAFPDNLNLYGRAMSVLLHASELYNEALSIREMDDVSFWRTRNDLPQINVTMTALMRERLGREVSSLLKSEGRGQQCSVESIQTGSRIDVFLYPDDFIRNDHTHDDDNRLTPHAFRPTCEIVLEFDGDVGTLKLSAPSISKSHKEEIERLFAKIALNWDLPPFDPGASYRLDHLKDSAVQLMTDPADQIRVRIEKMMLFNQLTGREHELRVRRRDPTDTIHQAILEETDPSVMPLSHADVLKVTFLFEFSQTPDRRGGRQTITVMRPRSCNLKNARPERADIIQKCLRLWEVDCATSDQADPVSVGA